MSESNIAVVPMPEYQCHKKVRAIKIKEVVVSAHPDRRASVTLHFEGNYLPMLVENAWYAKHSPVAGGYFVVYEDGYQSFSPAKAFEEGYTLIR